MGLEESGFWNGGVWGDDCLRRSGKKLIWILRGLFGLFNFCLLCIVESLIEIHDIFLLGWWIVDMIHLMD